MHTPAAFGKDGQSASDMQNPGDCVGVAEPETEVLADTDGAALLLEVVVREADGDGDWVFDFEGDPVLLEVSVRDFEEDPVLLDVLLDV